MKAQMKIQQMAIMIVAVFFFFILVGLFFVGWQYKSIIQNYEELQKEQVLSSLDVIASMPELSCGELCLDEDKMISMKNREEYDEFWPVASIKVYKIYPKIDEMKECPSKDCNYFEIYDSGQRNVKEFATYVSVCKTIKEQGYAYDDCGIGKISLGVILNEE